MTPVAFLSRPIQFQTTLKLNAAGPVWIETMLHNNDTGGNLFFKLSLLRRSNGCRLRVPID
ncbi:hypothetical protein [Maricaulis maris]|uniref:hypothetical protein n=1 Tax=Maricaulis maris TaxID=74318 RepID=UPI003B8C50F0